LQIQDSEFKTTGSRFEIQDSGWRRLGHGRDLRFEMANLIRPGGGLPDSKFNIQNLRLGASDSRFKIHSKFKMMGNSGFRCPIQNSRFKIQDPGFQLPVPTFWFPISSFYSSHGFVGGVADPSIEDSRFKIQELNRFIRRVAD
jgi:hypothetical protein